jgi:hypothetical protein
MSGELNKDESGEESRDDEDMDVPVKDEIEEDIPLAKSGYDAPPSSAYPPIKVRVQ